MQIPDLVVAASMLPVAEVDTDDERHRRFCVFCSEVLALMHRSEDYKASFHLRAPMCRGFRWQAQQSHCLQLHIARVANMRFPLESSLDVCAWAGAYPSFQLHKAIWFPDVFMFGDRQSPTFSLSAVVTAALLGFQAHCALANIFIA